LVIFGIGSHVYAWACLDCSSPIYTSYLAGMTGTWHMPRFFFWYWGLHSGLTPWATPPALFCDVFFKIESRQLFAWTVF
jgi:hypothetical protein